jgi:hypothetical protein
MKKYQEQSRSEILFAAGLVVIAIASRLLFNALHVFNFNAVIASSVFAGAYLSSRRWTMMVPILSMLLTDAIIGFYDVSYMFVVYGAFMAAFFIGRYYSSKHSFLRYILVTVGGSLSFFLITNFAWWPFYTTLYPHTWGGLVESYSMALPFYKNSILSDMLFSAILFGGFEMAKVFLPQPKTDVVLN